MTRQCKKTLQLCSMKIIKASLHSDALFFFFFIYPLHCMTSFGAVGWFKCRGSIVDLYPYHVNKAGFKEIAHYVQRGWTCWQGLVNKQVLRSVCANHNKGGSRRGGRGVTLVHRYAVH